MLIPHHIVSILLCCFLAQSPAAIEAVMSGPPSCFTCDQRSCTHGIAACHITKQHEVLALLTMCGLHMPCSDLTGCCSLLPVTHFSQAPASVLSRCLPISTIHLLCLLRQSVTTSLEHMLLACRGAASTQSCTFYMSTVPAAQPFSHGLPAAQVLLGSLLVARASAKT